MAQKIPTVSLIGLGYVGKIFARLLTKNSHLAKTKYFCDTNLQTVLKISQLYPGPKIVTSYEEVVADPDVDAVLISSPTATHYPITKAALSNGKHVFVEKPITEKHLQATELDALAQKSKLKLMVGHTLLYNQYYQKTKSIVSSRDFGDVLHILSTRHNYGPLRPDSDVLWDLSPHDLSMIIDIVGSPPNQVYVSSYPGNDIDYASINLTFKSTIISTISLNRKSQIRTRLFIVIGTKQTVIFDDLGSTHKVTVYSGNLTNPPEGLDFRDFDAHKSFSQEMAIKIDIKEPMELELLEFIDCIVSDKQPLSDGKLASTIVKLIEDCHLSLHKNLPIKFATK